MCAVLVSNDCSVEPCVARSLGLAQVEAVRLDRGLEEERTPLAIRDGVLAADLPLGIYRIRRVGDRSHGLQIRVGEQPWRLDTRAGGHGARVTGVVRIRVSGGAEGNTTVSDGGPGAHLVVAVLGMQGEQVTSIAHVFTDAEGRFETRLPPGDYYFSDAGDGAEDRALDGNRTPVRGQRVVVGGAPLEVELFASEMAP